MRLLPAVLCAALLACCSPGATPPPTRHGMTAGPNATGLLLGTSIDGEKLVVGEGRLKGQAIVLNYFTTW